MRRKREGRRRYKKKRKKQGKDVWKSTKRKSERLKGAFIKVRRRSKKSWGGG